MSSPAHSSRGAAQDVANLRLPVPFFDLLMVLLVTCLVFVAPVKPDGDVEAMDVTISQGKAASAPGALLPVTASHTAAGWTFRSRDGAVMGPRDLAARATAEHRKVALIVPPSTAVQDFVDMQSTLAGLGVPFALAIRNKETAP